jgi:opacity protein-like surface antigen
MLAVALALLLPAAISAQSASDPGGPSVVLFANGGGYSPVTDLNSSGTASLSTGWAVGGGAGVQLNPYVAIRAGLDYARSEGDEGSVAFDGQTLRHWFYGGDLQLRYPLSSGLAPYLLAGAGAVTINGEDTPALDESFTKFAGKGGLGVEYSLPRGFTMFVQGSSYIYKLDEGGFDKTQVDVLWNAGLTYRFAL